MTQVEVKAGNTVRRVRTRAGEQRYGQPMGSIIVLDANGNVVSVQRPDGAPAAPAGQAPAAPAADAPAAPAAPAGSAAAGALRARMAVRADDDSLTERQRENARAIADDDTVQVVADGAFYIRRVDAETSNTGKAGWIVGDPGSGLTFGAPGIVGSAKEATALAERFADLTSADGTRLGDVDNLPDALRDWRGADGESVGQAVLRARGEHDIAKGKPNSEWARAYVKPERDTSFDAGAAEMDAIREDRKPPAPSKPEPVDYSPGERERDAEDAKKPASPAIGVMRDGAADDPAAPAKRGKPEPVITPGLKVGDVIEVDGDEVTITGFISAGRTAGSTAGGRGDTVTVTGTRADGSLWWDSREAGARDSLRVTRVAKAPRPEKAEPTLPPSTYTPASTQPVVDVNGPNYDPTWSESSQNAALDASRAAEEEGTADAHKEAMVAHRRAVAYPGTDSTWHSDRQIEHSWEWRRLTSTPAKQKKYEDAAAAADALGAAADHTDPALAKAASQAHRVASEYAEAAGLRAEWERHRTAQRALMRATMGKPSREEGAPSAAPSADAPSADADLPPMPTQAAEAPDPTDWANRRGASFGGKTFSTRKGAEGYAKREGSFAGSMGAELDIMQRPNGRWEVRWVNNPDQIIRGYGEGRGSDVAVRNVLRMERAKGEDADPWLVAYLEREAAIRGLDVDPVEDSRVRADTLTPGARVLIKPDVMKPERVGVVVGVRKNDGRVEVRDEDSTVVTIVDATERLTPAPDVVIDGEPLVPVTGWTPDTPPTGAPGEDIAPHGRVYTAGDFGDRGTLTYSSGDGRGEWRWNVSVGQGDNDEPLRANGAVVLDPNDGAARFTLARDRAAAEADAAYSRLSRRPLADAPTTTPDRVTEPGDGTGGGTSVTAGDGETVEPVATLMIDPATIPNLSEDDLRASLVQAIVKGDPALDALRAEADARGLTSRHVTPTPTPQDRQPPRVPAGSRLTAVTLPDGTHEYRISKGRGYTHVVMRGPGAPEDRAAAAEADVKTLQREIDALEKAIANPRIRKTDRRYRKTDPDRFTAWDYGLEGPSETYDRRSYLTITATGNEAGEAETWRKYAEGVEVRRVLEPGASGDPADDKVVISAAEYLIAKAKAKRLSLIEQQQQAVGTASAYRRGEGLGNWTVLRWSSRRELAEAAATTEFAGLGRGQEVRVVEVDAVVDRRAEEETTRDTDPANLTPAERAALTAYVEGADMADTSGDWRTGPQVASVTRNRLQRAGLIESVERASGEAWDSRWHLTDAGFRALGMEPRPRSTIDGGWQVGDVVPYVDARTGEESEQPITKIISRGYQGVQVRLANRAATWIAPKDTAVVPEPEPVTPEPTPEPEPVDVIVEPEPTVDPTVVPPIADAVAAAEFVARHLGVDGETERALAMRLRGTGTWAQRSAAHDLLAAHPQKTALDQAFRLLRPSTRGGAMRRTDWDQERGRAALQRWVQRDPSLPENTLGARVQMMVSPKPREIDVSGQRIVLGGKPTIAPPGFTLTQVSLQDEMRTGTITEVVVGQNSGDLYLRMVDDDGDEHFRSVIPDATMTRVGPRLVDLPEPEPQPEPVVTPDPEPVTPEPVVEPTPEPEPPVLPKVEGREDVVARDVAVGDRLYEADGIGEVVDIQDDDGSLLFDLRMDDGTSLSVMADPSEVLSRVPALVAGEPEPVVITPPRPRRRRAAAAHTGEPVGRPALATYQRRMIVSYAIEADETQTPEAREAAALVRDRKALTSDQAEALAGALRRLAGQEKPRRAGALERAAGRFDLAVDNIALSRNVPDSPVTARRLLAGQRVRIAEYAGKALVEGAVVDIRRQQGGRIVTLIVEDDGGQRHVRVLLSGTQVTGLPARITPPVDITPEPIDVVVEPTPEPEPLPEPEPPVVDPEPVVDIPTQPTREERLAEIERQERLYEERLRAERGLDQRWRKVGSDFAASVAQLQPGDIIITSGGTIPGRSEVGLPRRLNGSVGNDVSNRARVVARTEAAPGRTVVHFTDGSSTDDGWTVAEDGTISGGNYTARNAVYAASPADIRAMRAREQARIDEAEADVPTEVVVTDLVHADIVVLPEGLTGRARGVPAVVPVGVPGYAVSPALQRDGTWRFTFMALDTQSSVDVIIDPSTPLWRLPALPDPEPVIEPDPEPRADGYPRPVDRTDVRVGDVVRIAEPLTGQDFTGTVQYVNAEEGEDEDGNPVPGVRFGLVLPGQSVDTSFSLYGDDTITLLERDDTTTETVVPAANAPVGSIVRVNMPARERDPLNPWSVDQAAFTVTGLLTEVEGRGDERTLWLNVTEEDGSIDTGRGLTVAATDPVVVVESNAAARIERERAEAAARRLQDHIRAAFITNAGEVFADIERSAVFSMGHAKPADIAVMLRNRRQQFVNRRFTGSDMLTSTLTVDMQKDGSVIAGAVAHVAESDMLRLVDDAIASFAEGEVRPDESERGAAERIMRALVIADRQRYDQRDAAALSLARFAEKFRAAQTGAAGAATPSPVFTPPTPEQRAARQQALADLVVEHRRNVARKIVAELGDSVDSKAAMKRAWPRVGNAAASVQSGTLEADPDLVARALEIASFGEGADRILSKAKNVQAWLRIEGALTLDDIANDLKMRRESSPIEWLDKRYTSADPEIDEGRRNVAFGVAGGILDKTASHLIVGGDEVQTPVTAVDIPATGSLADRVAKVRAALPGGSIGKRRTRRKTFAPITVEQLAAGEEPTIVDTDSLTADKAQDGGPGEQTLAQLGAIKGVGRLVREEVARRSLNVDGGDFFQYGGPQAFLDRFDDLVTAAMQKDVENRNARMVQEADEVRRGLDEAGFGIAGMQGVWASNLSDLSAVRRLIDNRIARVEAGMSPKESYLVTQTRDLYDMHPWLDDPATDLEAVSTRLSLVYENAMSNVTVFRSSAEGRNQAADLRLQRGAAQRAIADLRSKVTLEVLSELRPMGTDGGRVAMKYATGERAAGVKAMRWAEQFYPTDWLEKAKSEEGWVVKIAGRGSYNRYRKQYVLDTGHGEKVTGAGPSGGTAIHELGHHMERRVPGLIDAEIAFLFDRTSEGPIGGRVQIGDNALTHIANDKKDSRGRKDRFRLHYTGREYAGRQDALEVFTTGIESVFAGSDYLDDDMTDFMLGVLATL